MRRIPGMVNAHTHMYSALAPLGMPRPTHAPENFLQILERVWWKLDRALDEASLRASARLYVAEALLHGTTSLVDHHESPNMIEGSLDILADACDSLGMRAVLCYGATERNDGRTEAQAGLAECRRFIASNTRPRVRGVIGLHASFTLSDESLREAGELCKALGTVCHVHLAEDEADVADARERGHANPLQRLLACGALPAGSILAHGVHLDEAAVRMAAEQRLWLVQNPRSNEGNAVGYPRALWASDRVALGTDGYAADMLSELDALDRLARAHADLERATEMQWQARLNAGRRLVAQRFGGSEVLVSDVVQLDPYVPGEPCRARQVSVAGAAVVKDGRLLHGDIDAIRAEAREQAPLLWKRLEALA